MTNRETRNSSDDMPVVDYHAASRLTELREAEGLSPEALAQAIKARAPHEPWGDRGTVDAHTIRRIEREGHVPRERVRFVLARYFGLLPHELWQPRHRKAAA